MPLPAVVANALRIADTDQIVLVPVILLSFATVAAALMAYGTHAGWAQLSNGFEFILLARRLQWPMAALSLVLCLVLVALIIAGRRRAWWLIGLAPVLALFVHRFATDPADRFLVVEDPQFVAAGEAGRFVADADWVVGLRFAEGDYAYPYAALYETPVVVHAEHDRRVAVMWSPYANRALAVQVGREVRGADLEVVSMPANALLLYNGRIGQFVNALTGLTPKGEKPEGFRETVPLTKTTWKAWRDGHPETKVLATTAPGYAKAPRAPIRPTYPMPKTPGGNADPEARVVLVGVKRPAALQPGLVTAEPWNLTADGTPALVFRDPGDGAIRAFDRRIDDLRPRFVRNTDRKRDKALFVDKDAGAGWSADGVAIDGPPGVRGRRLAPLPVEDGLYWGVMKHWYPSLEWAERP